MKRNTKKLISSLLLIVLCLGLFAGCGSAPKEENSGS